MVLQDVDNQAQDSFSDNPNPSDIDPYASSSAPGRAGGERFDASSLPRPIPIIGPFIGFSERALRFKTDTAVRYAEKKIGRSLGSEESQALAFHLYKLEKMKSYYTAAGASAGAYRWWATRSTNQYPFYKPKPESIDPNKFGPIRGPAANLARQSWRCGLYLLVAGQMGDIIGQIISQPIVAYETSVDPKLEEFAKDLKAANGRDDKANGERARMIEERKKDFEARRRQEGTGGMVPPYGGRQERKQAPPPAGDDDMSPTAGSEPWGTSSSSSWGDFASEEQPQPQPEQQSTDVRAREPARQPAQPTQSASSPFDYDASPTGGLFQSESSQPTAQPASRPGESSWERLRRGAAAPPQQGASQQERVQRFASTRQSNSSAEGSTASDSYQEARDAERERAQREFDERLERERQGGDFNEGREKRW